jgi:hypothetical protein
MDARLAGSKASPRSRPGVNSFRATFAAGRWRMANEGEILLTVFLRHQQDKNLGEINAKLDATGFWKQFPPPGIEVESWYVMMGIGQVVTLRVPAPRLREVNLSLEKCAWGAFSTEFYPTYDFRPVWKKILEEKR